MGEPAVDDGGPLREFLHLVTGAIATINYLFHGREECRVPAPNQAALEKLTYKYVGEMMAVSLVHGSPAPAFLAPSVVDYIAYGMNKVQSSVNEVLSQLIKSMLEKVSIKPCYVLAELRILYLLRAQY